MAVQQIVQFLNRSAPGIINFKGSISEKEMKAVRSAVLVFNFRPREIPLISSYTVSQVRTTCSERLKAGDLKTWFLMAAIISSFALTVYFGYYFSGGSMLTGICGLGSYAILDEHLSKTNNIVIKIEPYNRDLPLKLANDKTDEGELVDPVTYDSIPNDQIGCGKYLYLSNYVVSSSPVMRVLVGKPFLKDQYNCLRFAHPLEGQTLSLNDGYDMTDNLEKIFGFDAIMIISPLYEFGKTATPAMKIRRFLNLFDQSAHPYLKGFEQDIKNLQQDL